MMEVDGCWVMVGAVFQVVVGEVMVLVMIMVILILLVVLVIMVILMVV